MYDINLYIYNNKLPNLYEAPNWNVNNEYRQEFDITKTLPYPLVP